MSFTVSCVCVIKKYLFLILFLSIFQGLFGIQTTQIPNEPSCRQPSAPRNGSVSIWGNGLLVEYICDPGTFAIGRTFGSCSPSVKVWSIKRPLCVALGCPKLTAPAHGQLYYDHNGTYVTAICQVGYRLSGSRYLHCDGYSWQGYKPRCRDRFPASRQEKRQINKSNVTNAADRLREDILDADDTCFHSYRTKTPPALTNATFKIEYKYNNVHRQWIIIANYTCADGYQLQDSFSRYRYCKDYKWKARVEPSCKQVAAPRKHPCNVTNGGCDHICIAKKYGRYSCDCREGYTLGPTHKRCHDINECTLDNGDCEHNCNNLDGSYFCSCRPGYLASVHRCLDIDECWSPDSNSCSNGCINMPGTYACNCTEPGFTQSSDLRSCIDKDECSFNNGDCEDTCINTYGSYECRCSSNGYRLHSDQSTCIDVDECKRYGDKLCKNGKCINVNVTYECTCYAGYRLHKSKQKCLDINECKVNNGGCQETCFNNPGNYTCGCHSNGFQLAPDGYNCIDINECDISNGACDDICTNTIGSYHCACSEQHMVLAWDKHNCTYCDRTQFYNIPTRTCVACPLYSEVKNVSIASSKVDCVCSPGFGMVKLMEDVDMCVDIDECHDDVISCDHICNNAPGSAFCTCNKGYRLLGNESCTDVNECSDATSKCDVGCVNVPGSFKCSCPIGYRLNIDGKNCDDVDECFGGELACDHDCINKIGGAVCQCKQGYNMEMDNTTCTDVDECNAGSNVCADVCINTPGSYECQCNDTGLKLSWDSASCSDINECMEGANLCTDVCVNSYGSYTCTCLEGKDLDKDGFTCKATNIDENTTTSTTTTTNSPTATTDTTGVDDCGSKTTHTCDQICIPTEDSFRCACYQGYSLSSFNTCAPCPADYYRSDDSPECMPCPGNSQTDGDAKTSITDCMCLPGYYGNVKNNGECDTLE